MTQSSMYNQILTTLLAALIASAFPASGGVPVGAAGSGFETLGDPPLMTNTLNIDASAAGAAMNLIKGDTVTSMAQIGVTATGHWKLTVEDLNSGSNKSKMRKYNNGYITPEVALTERVAVLVNNVGYNGASGVNFDTLTDVTDLSTAVDIVVENGDYNGLIDLMYSQEAVGDDKQGFYRIDLRYTLSDVET